MIKLGDRITVKPATFDVPGKDGKPKAIPGTVVYINPAGRYCVLEFDVPCSVATLAHGASRKSSRRKASVSRGAIPSSAKWEANISTDGRRARTARLPLW